MTKPIPSKSDIALLESFTGLTFEHIYLPGNTQEFTSAMEEIMAAGIVGFDTESKPTFVTGDISEGPHVAQFALHDKAFIFQLMHTDCLPCLGKLLQSDELIKVGFGLKSDNKHIRRKLGIGLGGVVDLNTVFSMMGYQKEIGIRSAVGLVLNQRFIKSRKVTTSNWSQPQLTTQQILYAANDAFGALKVLEALNIPRDDLPIMGEPQHSQNEMQDTKNE